MDFIIYAVIAAVAFSIGWNVRGAIILVNLAKDPQKFINMLKEVERINQAEAEGKIIPEGIEVEAEEVNGHWYAYVKNTNQFLAQGTSLEDALKLASERFPGKKFWCDTSNEIHQRA